MKMMFITVLSVFALAALVLRPAMTTGEPSQPPAPDATQATTPAETCAVMMHDSGASEDAGKAMQELMQSPKGAHAMTNMMEMARRMGSGDVTLGMTRMMEMMGGTHDGGMMSGPRGMMQPGDGGATPSDREPRRRRRPASGRVLVESLYPSCEGVR